MKTLLGILLAMFFLQTSVHALDKVRIGFLTALPNCPASFGRAARLLQRGRTSGRVHPDSANRCNSSVSQRRN